MDRSHWTAAQRAEYYRYLFAMPGTEAAYEAAASAPAMTDQRLDRVVSIMSTTGGGAIV